MGRGKAKKNVKTIKKKVSKKFLLSTFSLEELLQRAQDEIDIFNWKEAQIYCQEALKREPDNLRTLEVSANLCIETGNLDGAMHCLGRSIALAPDNGFTKYLSMAQLLAGRESLKYYLVGIELINKAINEQNLIIKKDLNKLVDVNSGKQNGLENSVDVDMNHKEEEKLPEPNNDANSLVRKLSNACCAIAELFMTELCLEDEAETESLAYIQKAINADSSNPEAYQQYADYLLVQQNKEEARENIKKSVSLWLPNYQKIDDGEACAGSFDPVEVCPISQPARYRAAEILIEVEEHKLAADVLETLLGEDDEAVHTWYLLGWNHYLQGEENKWEAKQNFEKALEIHKEAPSEDPDIIENIKKLLEELKDVQEPDDDEDDDAEIEELEKEIDEMEVS